MHYQAVICLVIANWVSQVMADHRLDKKFWLGWGGVVITILFLVLGNILNKIIANSFDGFSIDRFLNPLFILAYAVLLVRGFIWIMSLKVVPLSVAYPFMSLSYPLILLVSYFMFDEAITLNRVLGTLFIVSGILFVGRR